MTARQRRTRSCAGSPLATAASARCSWLALYSAPIGADIEPRKRWCWQVWVRGLGSNQRPLGPKPSVLATELPRNCCTSCCCASSVTVLPHRMVASATAGRCFQKGIQAAVFA